MVSLATLAQPQRTAPFSDFRGGRPCLDTIVVLRSKKWANSWEFTFVVLRSKKYAKSWDFSHYEDTRVQKVGKLVGFHYANTKAQCAE